MPRRPQQREILKSEQRRRRGERRAGAEDKASKVKEREAEHPSRETTRGEDAIIRERGEGEFFPCGAKMATFLFRFRFYGLPPPTSVRAANHIYVVIIVVANI
jgi:hypothetical protein